MLCEADYAKIMLTYCMNAQGRAVQQNLAKARTSLLFPKVLPP